MTSDCSHKSESGSFIFELGATFGEEGWGGGVFCEKGFKFKGVDIDISVG